MSYLQDRTQKVVIEPAPEFTDVNYAGDASMFIIRGNDGYAGKISVASNVPGAPSYDNSLDYSEVDYFDENISHHYKKFKLDFLITKNVKVQSVDLKVTNCHFKDFVVVEVLYLADPANDVWILAKRFVERFYMNTDYEDQDTPTLPYSKYLQAGMFAMRLVYHKSNENNQDVYFRANYMLHEKVLAP